MGFRFLIKFCIPVIALATSHAWGANVCGLGAVDSIRYNWCIDTVDGAKPSGDVIYFLHGMFGSERSWLSDGNQSAIRQAWTAKGIKAPPVISVSFGPAWLLTEIPYGGHSSRQEMFIRKIMPHLEGKLGFAVKSRRLYGESMGGFSAAQLLLKNSELFSKVALICPAINDMGPFASEKEVDDFVSARPHVNRWFIDQLLQFSRGEFVSQENWLKHDPVRLAGALSARSPEILMTAWELDDYGFHDGSLKFKNLAQAQGARLKWTSMTSGGHCQHDARSIEELAGFLVK